MKQDNRPTALNVPCRASYVHVFEPHAIQPGQDKKYSAMLLIDKNDTQTVAAINAAIKAAAEEGKASKWHGKLPANLRNPLRDGDKERPDDPSCAGKFFMNCSSKNRPAVVDRRRNPITDPDDFYSGCYANVRVNMYPYAAAGNNGVAAGLGNLQKVRDGERFGNYRSPMDDFDDLGEDEEAFEVTGAAALNELPW